MMNKKIKLVDGFFRLHEFATLKLISVSGEWEEGTTFKALTPYPTHHHQVHIKIRPRAWIYLSRSQKYYLIVFC